MDTLIGAFSQSEFEEVRVQLKKLKGRDFCDIRAYASLKSGAEKIPTGKGVTIDLARWGEFRQLISETDDQLRKHR